MDPRQPVARSFSHQPSGQTPQPVPRTLSSDTETVRKDIDIGSGAQGCVTYGASTADGRTAMRKTGRTRGIEKEAAILRQLSHPAIPTLLGLEPTSSGDHATLLETRAPGFCLGSLLRESPLLPSDDPSARSLADQEAAHAAKTLPVLLARFQDAPSRREALARVAIYELLLVLEYCHSQKIAHRDIKPENLIFNPAARDGEPRLHLVDFGLAEKAGARVAPENGTPGYMDPAQEIEADCVHDRWSVGALLFALVNGVRPFAVNAIEDSLEPQKLFWKAGSYRYSEGAAPQWSASASDECKHFYEACCPRAPADPAEIRTLLGHSWLAPVAHAARGPLGTVREDEDSHWAAQGASVAHEPQQRPPLSGPSEAP